MLFSERVPHTANALLDGCFGHIYRRPVNTYRAAALIPLIKFKQNISTSSRSIARHHSARTLSNNRRTLSLISREICLRNRFDLSFTLQNQEDCGPIGRQIQLCIDQFLPELTIAPTIKIKPGKSPQRASLRYGGLFTA